MCDSYDAWLKGAEEAVMKFTKDGVEVHKVDVDVEKFLAWATKEKVTINSFARADFANLELGKDLMNRLNPSDKPMPSRDELKQVMRKAKGMDLSEVWEPYLRRPKAAVCPISENPIQGRSKLDRVF